MSEDILEPGALVGDYVIVEKLGRGGMCEVYRANDAALGRDVAIKVMLEPIVAEEDQAAFFEEARMFAKLRHSNIVPLYSVGINEGVPWIAMACIDGSPLSEYLMDGGCFSLDSAKSFLEQAIAALSYAAKSNIIHLDIKPGNFLIDTHNTILLSDFGLARRISEIESEVHEGKPAKGTPAYASPEHFLRHKLDVRSDIYSLGATVFHLITGQIPYGGETAEEICTGHLQSEFPGQLLEDSDIPAGWSNFIRKMMEKDPNDRFQNYDQVLMALRSIDSFIYSTGHTSLRTNMQYVPRWGGDPNSLYGMVPESLAAKREELFLLGHPTTEDFVRDCLKTRWPVMKLNNLVEKLLLLQVEAKDDVDDTLMAVVKIPQLKETVLKLSSFMADDIGTEISKLEEQLRLVGLDRARDLAIITRALSTDWQAERPLNFYNFWEHSIYKGLLATLITDGLELNETGFEFACGFLYDIGKLVFLELFPNKSIAVWLKASMECRPIEEVELEYFGITHHALGAEWLRRHKFDRVITSVIETQNNPVRCFDAFKSSAGILRTGTFFKRADIESLALVTFCASSLCNHLRLGHSGSGSVESTPWMEQDETLRLLALGRGLTEDSLDRFEAFFSETCLYLPELAISKLGTVDYCLRVRKQIQVDAAKQATIASYENARR